MIITQNLSPNFTTGRQGRKPIAIVNHITDGAFPGCMTWLCNPQSQGSSHYIVTKAGQVYQLVKDEDTAWCNGAVNKPTWTLYNGTNPNLYTLSIEHEGYSGEALTEPQYQAALELHRMLCAKWGIPRDRDHIIGHYQIDSVNRPNCPGALFPWARLIADLQPKHWAQGALDELVAAGIISTPDAWLPLDAPVSNARTLALIASIRRNGWA